MRTHTVSARQNIPPLWGRRRYLPHFYGICTQMITFRLHDSLPKNALQIMQQKLDAMPRSDATRERQQLIDDYLDRGYGESLLGIKEIATIVENAILLHDGRRYDAHAWVIMPNHVHTLITVYEQDTLDLIVHSWKVRTAKQVNFLQKREGPLWYPDYFDRYMRSEAHFERSIEYIEMNPVKAGLCSRPEDWRFGSGWRELRHDEKSPSFNPVILDRFMASLPML
jgi:REP element-mobilizing transposase RayT